MNRLVTVLLAVGSAALFSSRSCAAEDVAAPAATKCAADVVIYRGSYPGWPWVARTPRGKLVCVWREGTVHDFSPTGRLMLAESVDDGITWADTRTIYDEPAVDDRNVAILPLTDEELLVCFNSYTQQRISRTFTIRSSDGGRSWQRPEAVCDLDARTRSAPIRLSTGELVLPFYRAPGNQSLAAVSTDGGHVWSVVEISNSPGFVGDEWDVCQLADDRLIGIIRNNAPDNGGWLYKTESRDRGRTWDPPARTNLRDSLLTSPAQIFVHQGRPVVLYADARMVSVAMATTSDPRLIQWDVENRHPCYRYRADGRQIADGSYLSSVPVGDDRRLIVDYQHDGDEHLITGYFVRLPAAWNAPAPRQ